MKKCFKILWLFLLVIMGLAFQGNSVFANDKNSVYIAMSLDDNFTYPTIVSMTSILENADKNTFCNFYLLLSGDFEKQNKEKLLKLKSKYENCEINLIDMKDAFKGARSDSRITLPSYYRLSLTSVLPQDIEKVIYLDGDTLTKKDLTAMFNTDISNYYVAGVSDYSHKYLKSFVKDPLGEICAGVMLMNLKKMREDNIEQKFNDFIKKNNKRLYQHDQTVINVVLCDHIFHLPMQYGLITYMGNNPNGAYKHATVREYYTMEDIKKAWEDPTILHLVGKKPWKGYNVPCGELWWEYAKKSIFWEEIKEKYMYLE